LEKRLKLSFCEREAGRKKLSFFRVRCKKLIELIPVYIGDLGRTSITAIFSASQPLKAYAGPGTDVLVNALLATDTVFEDTRVYRINFSDHLVALRE
jgi:hypothetical protein